MPTDTLTWSAEYGPADQPQQAYVRVHDLKAPTGYDAIVKLANDLGLPVTPDSLLVLDEHIERETTTRVTAELTDTTGNKFHIVVTLD